MTIDNRMTLANSRPSGFDYLRISLAILVVISHVANVNHGLEFGEQLLGSYARPLILSILPMFFCLSGFLVAGSIDRSKTVIAFLYLRSIRIIPALFVETVLSAFLIGPLFTTLTLHDYFRDPLFHNYMLNVIGDVQFYLPGVFLDNPYSGKVNAQLWTVPYELKCYIVAAILMCLSFHRNRWLFLGAAIVLQFVVLHSHGSIGDRPTKTVPGNALILAFVYGVTIYLFRDKIVHSILAAIACVLAICILSFVPYGAYLVCIPVSYMTVFLGVTNPRRHRFLQSGDYSYGIFVYGFVVQQSIAALGEWTHTWYTHLLLCIPSLSLIAYLSWHLVEKNALRAKRFVPWIERMSTLSFRQAKPQTVQSESRPAI